MSRIIKMGKQFILMLYLALLPTFAGLFMLPKFKASSYQVTNKIK